MINRRDFIFKAGTMAVIPFDQLYAINNNKKSDKPFHSENDKVEYQGLDKIQDITPWNICYDNQNVLNFENNFISINGMLCFKSGNEYWNLDFSRDGVSDRYTLIDKSGNVQGYWVLSQVCNQLELHFYHRTAQRFKGTLSFAGKIKFVNDAFPCRTIPDANERVLHLTTGSADSLINDSLFSPEKDLLFRIDAPQIDIEIVNDGEFNFFISGNIEEATSSTFIFDITPNYMQKRYVPYYSPINRKRCPKIPTGWMSWNTYFDKATAEDNLAEARLGKKYLQPFGCEFWSIESWQGNSDKLPVSSFYNMNLEVNEKQFPKGMKALADDIRNLGFRPGLWTAPFGTGNKDFYESHKNWFLHDKTGKPISSWNGKYTLDPTVEEARNHLSKIHRIASNEWGYEFFKIDGMSGRHHSYSAHLYERTEIKECFSNTECKNPFELCIKAIREGIGEDRVFLACQGHTSGPEALYADASRIGADIVHPNESTKWPNILNQAECFINQAFTHNIVMYADPDTLLVGDLPVEEARVTATIVALPGQLTFFGDKLATLSKDQIRILQQTLPVVESRPNSLYPHFSMLPIWNLNVSNKYIGKYNVIAFFNWEDDAKQISVSANELGIDGSKEYIAYEFWTENALPTNTKENNILSIPVPPRAVRIVLLQEKANHPQWIGSNRHIAQNGMEFINYQWENKGNKLTGKLKLIEDFSLTMRIKVPDDYTFKKIDIRNTKYTIKNESDNLIVFTFSPSKNSDEPFQIIFEKLNKV